MHTNPLLKRLGLAGDDRAIIINADDIGSSHASLAAYAALVDGGLFSSASVIVPGPWFAATAAFCRANGGRVDMGVHITLTSEHDGCRWSPLSTRDPSTGLLDANGYLYRDPADVRDHADAGAVQAEMQAQVERALAAGIDVTHIDTHQFTVAERPDFFESYIQVAMQFGIPPLLVRGHAADLYDLAQGDPGAEATGDIAAYMTMLEEQGLPVLDNLYMIPLRIHHGRVEQMRRVLDIMPPGISGVLLHPAQDTPELRAFSTDWEARVADFAAFDSSEMRALFEESGVHVIGWRVLRDLMRAGA